MPDSQLGRLTIRGLEILMYTLHKQAKLEQDTLLLQSIQVPHELVVYHP